MTQDRWFVTQDGAQLPGDYDRNQVAGLLLERAQCVFLVWKEGMGQWTDPRQLAEFAPPPVQGPPPARAHAVPRPAAAAPGFEPAGFFRALFDIRFNEFITPKIISIVYVIAMVLVGLGFLFMVWSGGKSIVLAIKYEMGRMAFMGLFFLVLAPVVSILYLALIRMFLEVTLVLFKIKDHTAAALRK